VTSNPLTRLLIAASTLLLAACNLPFLGDEEAKIEAKREAEGKAVGSGCRYSGRAIEECYGMNPKTSKAAIFAGWRDMDGYMRENNIQIVSPEGEAAPADKGGKAEAKPTAAEAAPAEAKPKAAEAAPTEGTPKAAEAAKPAAATQGVRIRKLPRHIA